MTATRPAVVRRLAPPRCPPCPRCGCTRVRARRLPGGGRAESCANCGWPHANHRPARMIEFVETVTSMTLSPWQREFLRVLAARKKGGGA